MKNELMEIKDTLIDIKENWQKDINEINTKIEEIGGKYTYNDVLKMKKDFEREMSSFLQISNETIKVMSIFIQAINRCFIKLASEDECRRCYNEQNEQN